MTTATATKLKENDFELDETDSKFDFTKEEPSIEDLELIEETQDSDADGDLFSTRCSVCSSKITISSFTIDDERGIRCPVCGHYNND